jgi:hypothetical protein
MSLLGGTMLAVIALADALDAAVTMLFTLAAPIDTP